VRCWGARQFEVLRDIKVADTIVIPKGGIAWGTVTEAQGKRWAGRGGKLEIVMDTVRLSDGEKAALRATKEAKGGGHAGAMTVRNVSHHCVGKVGVVGQHVTNINHIS
jgi:hypothetical protein